MSRGTGKPSATIKGAQVRQICPDTRLIVVDSQRLFRDAVRLVTKELCPQVDVIGDARDRREAIRLARRLKPDIALLSVQGTLDETLLAIRSMRRRVPECRIVVLIEDEDPAFAFKTVMAGGSGYIPRRCSSGELVLAISTAREDGLVMPRPHLSLAFKRLGHPNIIRLDQPSSQVAPR